jgi:uncharacterized membrane protein
VRRENRFQIFWKSGIAFVMALGLNMGRIYRLNSWDLLTDQVKILEIIIKLFNINFL